MLKQLCWQRILIELTIVITIALILGLIIGYPITTLLIFLFLLLCWHFYNQIRLSGWLWGQNSLYPPSSYGSWDIIFYGLHRRQKRHRQRQNELAEVIKRFRYGVESLPDSIIITAADGRIDWCNQLAQFQLNIRWPDDKGQNIINLIRQPEFAHYMRSKDFSKPFTLLFGRGYIEFRILPYSQGQWVIVVRDVDQLYLAEKLRHDFFTNASHELRTPITVLKGYLDMFSEGLVKSEKQDEVLNIMQGQVSRMELLISQILMLSQIESAPIKEQLQKVNMPEILLQIQNDICQINTSYHFIFNIDEKLLIEGHKEQLYSAVSNLIYNAVKHNPEGTQITVDWKRATSGAYFSVTDTGPGIEARHLARLTERFYQVDAARTNKAGGSGLGLAIVKHALINHSNTKLEITSEMGKGSRFAFTLPTRYIIN
ncbi:phosphate regulon sensor histidine kinase PhoR [Zophobihabitans entericus]|uniref:histidine kinase n=1 Tax=Zophobihabitans entericus TaxID=1635327 RepID=A0A6G9IE18_9GAMM|nr:phosphate regulon sensor histidine kinase PhoR [Zophobihabitans entericus]QIQ22062.1 phosphate regulon sensor histidine kinase PhoR [Zophobihabitans entericus]